MECVRDGDLEDPAVLADDMVDLDDLRAGDQLQGPGVAQGVSAVRVDADEGLDAVTEEGGETWAP